VTGAVRGKRYLAVRVRFFSRIKFQAGLPNNSGGSVFHCFEA
jgi:hypothetical protein